MNDLVREKDTSSLLYNLLGIDSEFLHVAVPNLAEYCQIEINNTLNHYIRNVEDLELNSDEICCVKNLPFTIEEDYQLFSFIKSEKEEGFENFIKRSTDVIKPIRSLKEIQDRIEYLRNVDHEKDIINPFTKKLLTEKMSYFSITTDTNIINALNQEKLSQSNFNACKCSCLVSENYEISEEADKRMDFVNNKSFRFITEMKFNQNELAMLRAENFYYTIKEVSVVLGKSLHDNNVSIDIQIENDSCPHISRKQAVISLANDFNFYIENIGMRHFRVNSLIIPSHSRAMLKNGSLLDFSDNLFLFIINESLIESLKEIFQNS